MSHTVHFNGGRDARGHLDTRESKAKYTIDSCVIACPPHPQHGGHSSDRRLRVVSDQLPPEIDCLRITYGSWDHGHGEYADVANALEWAHNRYDQCGLFGYSFGAALAIGVALFPSKSTVPKSPIKRSPSKQLLTKKSPPLGTWKPPASEKSR